MQQDKNGNIIGQVQFHLDELIDSNHIGLAVMRAIETMYPNKPIQEITRRTNEALLVIAAQAKKAAYRAGKCAER